MGCMGASVRDYFSSLTTSIPGLNVSATLHYLFDTGNHSDEADFVRSQARYETALLNRQALERNIDGGVGVAAALVKNSAAIWRLSEQSARTYRLLTAAELKKYRMGMSDLFKVQSVTTDLANAEKQLLASKKAYASSLLTLRFQLAALMEVRSDGQFSVEECNLVTVPQPEQTGKRP